MKKIFTLILSLSCIIALAGCTKKDAPPLSGLDGASLIQLSYLVEEEEKGITFSDARSVTHICDDLEALTLKALKESPAAEVLYGLTFYADSEEMLQHIDILDEHTLSFGDRIYQITEGELDLTYLENAIETVEYVQSTTK